MTEHPTPPSEEDFRLEKALQNLEQGLLSPEEGFISPPFILTPDELNELKENFLPPPTDDGDAKKS